MKWIAVSERMPTEVEAARPFGLYFEDGTVAAGWYEAGLEMFWPHDGPVGGTPVVENYIARQDVKVTHFLPLPAA